ncbi:MAG TPA: WYL domain-containing protein [Flavobacteriaceae bacterium]|nr:WYL domain-containing protein [Flavobacteriaceae bacterium]
MAVNKNALIRYKTIDKCLQNRMRKWTLNNLIEACSDALYEYEGKDCDVSKRTIQSDIFTMRSDKLGYNAPIIVVDRKYYTYEDKNYSITNLPISASDLEKLAESVTFLKQFKGFSHFNELNGVIQKLEDHVYSAQTKKRPVIEFEKNEDLKGLKYLDTLYQAIIKAKTIEITYKSFKARQATNFVFHAYLLKEFRNRWFVIGIRDKQKHLVNLALDRIIDLQESEVEYEFNNKYDLENYFSKAIGVSINPNLKTEEILLFIYNKHAPYVITKPFHPSQKVISKDIFGITISLDVQHNFELEKEILGLGDGIKVVSPNGLKRRIKERLAYALDSYNTELSDKIIKSASYKFEYNGASIVNQVFSLCEIKKVHKLLHKYDKYNGNIAAKITDLFITIPELENLIISDNIIKIVNGISKKAKLIKAVFYRDNPLDIIDKKWFQNKDENIFTIRIHLKETNQYNHLDIISGSHKKVFTKKEINLLVENSVPFDSQIRQGVLQILDNRILRKWIAQNKQQRCNIIELTYKI